MQTLRITVNIWLESAPGSNSCTRLSGTFQPLCRSCTNYSLIYEFEHSWPSGRGDVNLIVWRKAQQMAFWDGASFLCINVSHVFVFVSLSLSLSLGPRETLTVACVVFQCLSATLSIREAAWEKCPSLCLCIHNTTGAEHIYSHMTPKKRCKSSHHLICFLIGWKYCEWWGFGYFFDLLFGKKVTMHIL